MPREVADEAHLVQLRQVEVLEAHLVHHSGEDAEVVEHEADSERQEVPV